MDINFNKTLSRLATIQIIYMLESKSKFSSDNIEKAIKDIQEYYKDLYKKREIHEELNLKFLKRLVNFTEQNITKIDEIINASLDKKETNRDMNSLLRAILRSGICEILYFKTPPKVSVDEYVKLTKDFFNSEEAGFVNALLDKVIKQIPFES